MAPTADGVNRSTDRAPEPPRVPMLTLRTGGWVIAAMLLVCAAIIIWAFAGVLSGSKRVGDGGDPATYGFDLVGSDLGGRRLVASGNSRDFLSPLDNPRTAAGRDILEINRAERGKYLVTTDRVVGVEIDGHARAYPLRLLNAHEVCNDELAGVPIAVTYSPLCDSVLVFDRRVAVPDGAQRRNRIMRFGVSGLLLDSNLLLYDRDELAAGQGDQPPGPRSLWSQLLARAVTGPDASADAGLPLQLTQIPEVQLVPWAMWLERRPGTTVTLRDDAAAMRIKRIDYARYWAHGEPLYPVSRLPDPASLGARGLNLMSPAVAVTVRGVSGTSTGLFALPEIARDLPATGAAIWSTDLAGRPVTLTFTADRRSAWVDAGDAVIVHGRWFALWERAASNAE